MSGLCANDYSFGPVSSCRILDFTLLFSNIFLSFIPAIIFSGLAIIRLVSSLRHKPRKLLPLEQVSLAGRIVLASKGVAGALLIVATVVRAVLWQRNVLLGAEWSGLLANTTSIIAAALTAIIVAVEHFRNNRPSQPPALYLLANLLLGISRIRTLAVLSSPSDPIIAAMGAVIGLELSLFVLLQISSRPWLKDGASLPSSATAGIVSRLLVSWTLPLLWSGYRRPLTAETIGPIDNNLHTDISAQYFEPQWKMQRKRYRGGKTKYPLLWACIRARPLVLAAPLLPWLISALIGMARPLIVLHTVNYVETASDNPDATAEAWALIGGTLLVFGIYAIATAMGTLASQYTGLAIKASLMEAIYRKSLRLKTEVAREMGAAKASNLMGSDLDLVVMSLVTINSVWTAVIQCGLGLFIIYTQIGLSFLASVGSAVAFFIIIPLLTVDVAKTRAAWAAGTDKRVKFMGSVLQHVKAIKLSAYEHTMGTKAIQLRDAEVSAEVAFIVQVLKAALATNWLSNFLSLTTITTFTLVSLFAAHGGSGVTTAKVFTVISTISLISDPLLMLGQNFSSLVSACASFMRIQNFLLAAESQDPSNDPTTDLLDDEFDKKDDTQLTSYRQKAVVRLEGASFGVSSSSTTLLHELRSDMRDFGLWMVIGQVGSGKSVLLQSILGELDIMAGTASIQLGRVGFCSQDPWLRNSASIKDNITFIRLYEKEWYDTVLEALALNIDIKTLPSGDATLVSSLSGGQKQRVALARAVYGKFDSYILDDVFSALDADTEAAVFSALFAEGGLLHRRPVILATNQVHRLPSADYITALDKGRVIEQGTYSQLARTDGIVASMIAKYAAGSGAKALRRRDAAETSNSTSNTEPEREQEVLADQETEVATQGAVGWQTYKLYLKSMGRLNVIAWFSGVIGMETIGVLTNVYLQAWTTSLNGQPPSRYGAFLGGYAALQLGVLLSLCFAIIFDFKYAHPASSRRLHEWEVRGLLSTPLAFFESRGVGQIINRFNADLFIIDMQLPNAALNCMSATTSVIGSAILMAVAGPYMIAVLGGTAIILVIIQRFYVRAARELRRLQSVTRSPIYGLFAETMQADGLMTIRAMHAQTECKTLMTNRATASQRPAWLLQAILQWLQLSLDMSSAMINTLLVVIATRTHGISTGILAVALTQASSLNGMLALMIRDWTQVEMCITSVERVQEYIELPKQAERAVSVKSAVDKDWLTHGSISFNHANARYKPELPLAMQDVTLNIKPGQKVGICGRTGSGKSTMLGVLWRLIEIEDAGAILVDGVDIRDIPLQEYRSAMSIIPQDPLLLELSLRENLDPESQHPDADIWSALEQSHLKAHIEALPAKLDEHISSDSGQFSRGQRQLLALARAILRRRRILALDEATSSIDVKTDAAIQETIRDAFSDVTVLTIAHRIATIRDYDLIVVMDAGRIIETGSPRTLMRDPNSHFRRLALENGSAEDHLDGTIQDQDITAAE